MKAARTFKLQDGKPMRGDDVKQWQSDIKRIFSDMKINCPIAIDGVYGQGTRSFSAELVQASGLSVKTAMKDGVTPELRGKLRNRKLSKGELKTRTSKSRVDYRASLRKRWASKKVHAPVSKIITDSWGWHPGVHDGVDVIATEGVTAFAMVKCQIIDARPHGWWHLGAPSNQRLRERGDGIVQMEVLEDVGPFKKGMHIGYGHCVHPQVRVGQIVEAGHPLARVGFANAGHIHLMVNSGKTTKGVGTQDPRPLINYAVKNG